MLLLLALLSCATDCIPEEECCRVCVEGVACGDTCIEAENECSVELGCACDDLDVCEGGPDSDTLE